VSIVICFTETGTNSQIDRERVGSQLTGVVQWQEYVSLQAGKRVPDAALPARGKAKS